MLYRHQDKLNEAESLFKRCLPIYEKSLGPERFATVTTILFYLATVYRDQGKLNEAESLFKRCLAIQETSLGPEHLGSVANTLHWLATLYREQGKLDEAQSAERHANEILNSQKKATKSIPIKNAGFEIRSELPPTVSSAPPIRRTPPTNSRPSANSTGGVSRLR